MGENKPEADERRIADKTLPRIGGYSSVSAAEEAEAGGCDGGRGGGRCRRSG